MIYRLILIFLVYSLACIGTVYGEYGAVDIQSYDISLKAEPENDLLRLSVTMELTKPDNLDEFMVLLTSYANIQSIEARDKTSDGAWINMLSRSIDGDTLYLGVHQDLIYSTELSIRFEYVLGFGDVGDRLILYREHHWYPMILGDIAVYAFSADLPDDYIYICTSESVESDDWNQDDNSKVTTIVPVSKFPVVIARKGYYGEHEVEDEFTGRSLVLYTLSLDDEGQDVLGSTVVGLFEYLHDSYGEYRHKSLILLENPDIKGADVSSGMIMFGSHVLDGLANNQPQMLHIAVARQWFGCGVSPQYGEKGYCFFGISLPQYLSMLYLRDSEDEVAFENEVNSAFSQYKPMAGAKDDIPVINITELHSQEKARIVYGKGPYILDLIRQEMGDRGFADFINKLYTDYKGRILTYNDFLELLSIADRAKSVTGRVRLMLSTTGIP
jgi:hypothetical protein